MKFVARLLKGILCATIERIDEIEMQRMNEYKMDYSYEL
jgi:hypothetical protein